MKTLATLIIGAVVVTSSASYAHADHVCRRHHNRTFEFANRELTRELERSRDLLRFDFEDQRDLIHARIRNVKECYRGQQRAEAVRALHRELEHVDRAYHRTLRALNEGAEDRRRALIHQRDDALRTCRTEQCVEACFSEPASELPSIEVIPPPETAPGYPHLPSPNHDLGLRGHDDFDSHRRAPRHVEVSRRDRRFTQPPPTRRPGDSAQRDEFDWQSLLVDVLARRLER